MRFRPRIEMSIEERVRDVLARWRPRYNARANDSIVLDHVQTVDLTNSGQAISTLVDQLAERGKVMYAPAVSEALEAAKRTGDNVNYNFNSFSFEKMVLDRAELEKFDITNAQDLADVMAALLYEGEAVPRSARGEQVRFETSQEKQRQGLIQRITLGRAQFVLPQSAQKIFLGVNHGKAINVDSRRIQGESLERLKELAVHVDAYRAARDGERVTPVVDHTPEGIVASVPSQKTVPYMGGAGPDLFVNPQTQREYSRSEVVNVAKNNLQLFRKLMAQDRGRLNRILAQA